MVAFESLLPMKAVTGTLPADETGWAFEIKWDGVRVLSSIGPKGVRLRSSRGNDISGRYPELRRLTDALNNHHVTDMFANYITGKKSIDDTIADAKKRLQDSLTKFPV